MTSEAYESGGSKLTVGSNTSNPASDWSYVTLFDGVFRPVQGQEGAETAVEIINAKSIRHLGRAQRCADAGGDQHPVGRL